SQRVSDHRLPHSFPTRRSSDLAGGMGIDRQPEIEFRFRLRLVVLLQQQAAGERIRLPAMLIILERLRAEGIDDELEDVGHAFPRSEEHTSELQSRENLVCRLLL